MNGLVLGSILLVLMLVVVVSADNECQISLTTHNVQGSRSEAIQEQHKLARGCWLKNQVEMVFKDHTDRYRYWCCPIASSSSASSKRTVAALNDSVPSIEEEEEEEQEDDLDQVVEATETYLPWNLNRLDQRGLPIDSKYAPPQLASLASQPEVHVFVIDSGIDASHMAFDHVTVSLDYPPNGGAVDCCKHGSAVASIIAGYVTGVVSRGVDGVESIANVIIHSVRALGCNCEGTVQDLIKALAWIQNEGPRPGLLAMSVGSPKSNSLNSALSSMTNSGDYIAIVAAGNDNVDACTTSPSSANNVIVVGATAENDSRASYSNYGKCLSIFAPGSNVYGALMGSRNQIAASSGTSFAQPHVTGLCVRELLRNTSIISLEQAWINVRDRATRGIVTNAGPLSPNLFAHAGSAPAVPNPPQPSSQNPNPPPPPPPLSSSTSSGSGSGSHPVLQSSSATEAPGHAHWLITFAITMLLCFSIL